MSMRPRTRGFGGIVGAANIPSTVAAPGGWDANAIARQLGGSSAGLNWPAQQDPSFANVSLLCHCNAPRANVALPGIASSAGSSADLLVPNAYASMLSGLTTATAKWGITSTYVSGGANNGLIFNQAASEFTLGAGDFAIELWFRPNGSFANQNLFDPRTAGNQAVPLVYFDASSKLRYFVSNADRITGTTAVSAGAWHHIAVARVSGSTRLYLDGAQEGSTYSDATSYVSIAKWYFGCQVIGTPGPGAPGYYQDIRITKGVGRYSGTTLTVPTGPFPDY